MTSTSLRITEDGIEDLKDVAPVPGFSAYQSQPINLSLSISAYQSQLINLSLSISAYQPVICASIGRGLLKDLPR
jgi:hypothetical protein